jgi:glycerol-3-phosphate acyltransferase PlsY
MIATAAIMAAWIVGGYLVGAIPFGWLIGKMRGVDIRQLGSKNIGATNCGRVCGWPCGVAAFLLDVLKGFLPVLAAVAWLPREIVFADEERRWLFTVLVAGSPILGHLLPVYLKFKGGKAVATSLGVVLALPMLRWVAVAAFVVWCLVVLATGYVSVASTVAALAFAGAYLGLEWARAGNEYLAVTVLVLLILGLLIIRHRTNYLRLIKGTENGVLWRKKKEVGKA